MVIQVMLEQEEAHLQNMVVEAEVQEEMRQPIIEVAESEYLHL